MNDESTEKQDNQRSLRDWLRDLFSYKPKDKAELAEDLREARERDILSADALWMLEGVLQVTEMQARDIMVPRSQMVVVKQDAKPEELMPILIESAHSRFPVVGETRDEIVGILLAKDLLRYTFGVTEQAFNLKNILRPAVFIPESKRLNVLLKEFRMNRNHMAIVLDEYGGVAGLVTIEDVLEQIVGEIEDEYDAETEHIKQSGEDQYTIKAITPIDEFNQFFQTHLDEKQFDTIGGLVVHQFGYLPKRGEMIKIGKLQFKVLHADKRRVRLLTVKRSSK